MTRVTLVPPWLRSTFGVEQDIESAGILDGRFTKVQYSLERYWSILSGRYVVKASGLAEEILWHWHTYKYSFTTYLKYLLMYRSTCDAGRYKA